VPSLVAATPCANLDDSNPFGSAALSSRHFNEGLRSVVPAVVEKIGSFIQPRPDDANAFLTQVFSTYRSRTGRHKHREPLEPRIPNRYQSESLLANTHIPNFAAGPLSDSHTSCKNDGLAFRQCVLFRRSQQKGPAVPAPWSALLLRTQPSLVLRPRSQARWAAGAERCGLRGRRVGHCRQTLAVSNSKFESTIRTEIAFSVGVCLRLSQRG
jgi:hypothetical protein